MYLTLKMPCSPQRNRTRGAGHSVPAPTQVERHSDCSHDGIVSWAKQYLRILNSLLSNMLEAQVDDDSQIFTHGGLGNPRCRMPPIQICRSTSYTSRVFCLRRVTLNANVDHTMSSRIRVPSCAKLYITGINLLLKLLKLYPACSALIGRVMLCFGLPREKHCLCSLVLAKNERRTGWAESTQRWMTDNGT